MASRKQQKHRRKLRSDQASKRTKGRYTRCPSCGKRAVRTNPELSALLCGAKEKSPEGTESLAKFIVRIDRQLLSHTVWLCRCFRCPDQDAGDYQREGYVQLLMRLSEYDCRFNPFPWTATMIKHGMISALRRGTNGQKILHAIAEQSRPLAGRETPATLAAELEEMGRFEQAVKELPESEQLVFTLSGEGMTLHEISLHTGYPQGTVATRLRTARMRLCASLNVPLDGHVRNGRRQSKQSGQRNTKRHK